jgi:hypothetical protein
MFYVQPRSDNPAKYTWIPWKNSLYTCRYTPPGEALGEALGTSERAGGGREGRVPICSLFEEQEPASSPQPLHAECAICAEEVAGRETGREGAQSSISEEGEPWALTI